MNESSNQNCCVIELRFCLKGNSHSMDTLLFNRCKKELLNIVRGVACRLGVEVIIRIEMLGEGGIFCCFIINSPEFWNNFASGIISSFVAAFLYDTVKKEIGELKSKIKGVAEYEKQMKTNKTESIPYKHVINKEDLYQYIDKKILRSRSNFYANLLLFDTVEGLTIRATDGNGAECFPEKRIAKDDFKGFIMSDNEVVPEYVNDAEIKIIPPIDIEGRHKWFGEYKGKPIRFDMRSNDFKKALQRGQIRIEDIVSIRCNLEIRRKIDKEYGDVVSKGYRVMDVIDY